MEVEISKQQQRKPSKGGWKSAFFIIWVEVAERFAYYGMSGNLITYLTNVLKEPTATAAKNVNIWFGISALLPLVGAFMADSYFGRFNTILVSSVIYLKGLVLLALSVSIIPARFRRQIFFLSLYIVAIAEGGHKPCVQAFGADQFDEDNPEEQKAKSSFFNWWYFGICIGAFAATLVVIYLQDNVGWAVGFAVSAGAMGMALVVFLLGQKLYRRQVPSGSPLTQVAQVFVAAVHKRNLPVMECGYGEAMEVQGISRNLAPTNQFRFLDKAAIVDNTDRLSGCKNTWRLCSVTQVEEVKLLIRLIPIWFSCLMYAVLFAQVATFFTKQGSTMNRKIGSNFHVPPASLQLSTGLVIMFFLPIYDRILVPVARKLTGLPSGVTMLQRIGIGMFLSIIGMVIAALVEARRIRIAREHGLLDLPKLTVPMSIWWLLPQYMIWGLADVFAIVGLQELFYDQMPDTLRSLGAAAWLSIIGVGSLLSSFVISIIQSISSRYGESWLGNNLNRAHLDYYYWVLAGLSTLWSCAYVLVAKFFIYKKIDGVDGDATTEEALMTL
ncbi:protein NRT1/ PTR FAMILY 5.4-like [Macadamia integrifolia]|uniref:protein NRT1/ PTR FAMILY 5.4-like n=1 Tax=Macadamia integrifolia TaxID=60698 RepID=UPI001C4E72EC|nr:protein NRT1/ PTR FAMILY 5.4-like [Macadamia integrifolia]